MICPKCNKEKGELRAMSRFSDVMICDECGSKEAIEVLYLEGLISKESYDAQINKIKGIYKEV